MSPGLANGVTAIAGQSSCKTPQTFLRILCLCVLMAACSPQSDPRREIRTIAGPTMGTSYSVKVLNVDPAGLKRLQSKIQHELVRLNRIFSTYIDDSEISRLNRQRQIGQYSVSGELWQVLKRAKEVSVATGGAFDITVSPLVELWGFGRQPRGDFLAIENELAAVMTRTGHRLYSLPGPGIVMKHHAEVNFDLSSIAKGYAVDAVARLLRQEAVSNFVVEIGGEIRTSGHKGMNAPWIVGLEAPRAGERSVQWTLELNNRALASSGDYRNYFEYERQRYSHLLDPRTGYPVLARNLAVNVVAAECMDADAWGTALAIVGREAGLALALTHGVAVQFLEDDSYYRSEEFEKLSIERVQR